jgi:hypothetical protein
MNPSGTTPFGDYEPKRTPDTIFDFRPAMHAVIEAITILRNPSIEQVPALVQLLGEVKAKARRNPGYTQPGKMMLGGDREEYNPSDDELLESYVGDLIKNVLAGAPKQQRVALVKKVKGELTYNRIRVRHSDVMGSGRFFYAGIPQPEKIQIEA